MKKFFEFEFNGGLRFILKTFKTWCRINKVNSESQIIVFLSKKEDDYIVTTVGQYLKNLMYFNSFSGTKVQGIL